MRIYLPEVRQQPLETLKLQKDLHLASAYGEFTEGDHLRLDLVVAHSAGKYIVRGVFALCSSAHCARCLVEFQQCLRGEVSDSFQQVQGSPEPGSPTEQAARTAEELTVEGDWLYLEEYLRQQVILAQAEKPLCRSDCRGLCAHCGADLNHTSCRCHEIEEPVDARLLKLKELKNRGQG